MIPAMSPDTQAILLLNAPLIAGKDGPGPRLLSQSEYTVLARRLRDLGRRPADLVAPAADALIAECDQAVPMARLRQLLSRGFLLAQALERWRSRAIWVISRADKNYPQRLKARLKEDCPPILYGCGAIDLLGTGGLAIVGAPEASDAVLAWTADLGRLAATAGITVVSGEPCGVDAAAVWGAVEHGGRGCIVLADSLEKQAISRSHRQALIDGRLVLLSPHDPATRAPVSQAQGPTTVIFALSDVALLVNSALDSSVTGASVSLPLPTYHWQSADAALGNAVGLATTATAWPEPTSAEALRSLIVASTHATPHRGPPAAGFFGSG